MALLAGLHLTSCGEVPQGRVPGGGYRPTAASVPSTDIYLGSLRMEDGALRIVDLSNVTNREGYDNQPHFLPDGSRLLHTSGRDTLQTDIYAYDLATGAVEQITHTGLASEYSAQSTPDGAGFTVIREDPSAQLLWRYEWSGGEGSGLLPDIQPVGYHAWGDEHTVALWILGDSVSPPTLRVADLQSGGSWIVTDNPGRSLHRVPGSREFSFVQKDDEGNGQIRAVDWVTRSVRTIAPALPDAEDYAWLPDGSIVMGTGPSLQRWTETGGWVEVEDLSAHGVRDISRIATSRDGRRIAIVGSRGAGAP